MERSRSRDRGNKMHLLLVFGLFISSALYAQDAQNFEQEAKNLANQLKSSLVKNLTEKIKNEGLEAAVPFCHANVKPIAKEAAKDYLAKYEFGRTSHKIRNEQNKTQPWQESYLKEFVGTFYDAKKAASYSKTGVLPDGKKFYIEPLFVQPLCLNCHGQNIAQKTQSQIKSLYPNDSATGFKLNEFRGLIWVKEK